MTRKIRLTIVDDELDRRRKPTALTRREIYSTLIERFEVHFIEHRADFLPYIRKNHTDLVLLDFVLEEWQATALDMLDDVPLDVPVALISEHWGPSFETLRKAIAHRPIATVFTWQDLADARRKELVEFWLDNIARRALGFSEKEPAPNESLYVLHISDLQFGSAGPRDIALEQHMTASEVRQICEGVPEICAITGDISEHGLPSEFKEASTWITGLVQALDPQWDASRTLAVPGNHDVCIPLALASRISKHVSLLPPEEQQAELKPFAFEPYHAFERERVAEGQRLDGRHFWVSQRYLQYGVIFFGYNTSAVLNDAGRPIEGLDAKELSDFTRRVSELTQDNPQALLVGLLHHPLAQNSMSWDRFIPAFGHAGTVVLLTGHLHKESPSITTSPDMSILNIGAATLTKNETKRGPDTPRGCHLLEFRRGDGGVTGLIVHPLRFRGGRLRRGGKFTFTRVGGQMNMGPIEP